MINKAAVNRVMQFDVPSFNEHWEKGKKASVYIK